MDMYKDIVNIKLNMIQALTLLKEVAKVDGSMCDMVKEIIHIQLLDRLPKK